MTERRQKRRQEGDTRKAASEAMQTLRVTYIRSDRKEIREERENKKRGYDLRGGEVT